MNEAQANPIAQEALRRIAALYVIEVQDRDINVDERAQLRQEHAQPLLQSMHDTLEKLPTCLNSQIDSLLPLRAEPILQAAS